MARRRRIQKRQKAYLKTGSRRGNRTGRKRKRQKGGF